MVNRLRLVPLVILLMGFPAGPAELASLLWNGLDPGPHRIGFEVLNYLDATRRLPDKALRPIQISVWYPAAAITAGPPVRYQDYVLVSARERTLSALEAREEDAALTRYLSFLTSGGGLPAAVGAAWLRTSMAAVPDAPPGEGRFPLILIAQGNGGAVQDQALLGEYLASHGYIVATSPSPARLGAVMTSDADVLPTAREQALDLAVMLERSRLQSRVDGRSAGVIGYSFGARSALLFAARTPGIRALVSLDGGIGTASAGPWLRGAAFDPGALRLPILHVFEDTETFMAPSFDLLRSLRRCDRALLKIAGLRHTDFITFGMASAVLAADGAPRPQHEEGIRAAFVYARTFMDAHLKGSRQAHAFLASAPEVNGYTPGLLTLERLPAGP